jgi:sporulation protein YlmC with PRC-barrel domain
VKKEESKMKKISIVILLYFVGLLLGTSCVAQEKMEAETRSTVDKPIERHRFNAFTVGKIIGAKVINLKGETLGKIENLVVDIDTGRIVYAILDSGGFWGIGSKLFPIPWDALAALPAEGIFFLNQSKEQMGKAPTLEKDNLPIIEDMHWGEAIFKHYGLSVYAQRALMGYGFGVLWRSRYLEPEGEDPYKKIFDPKTIRTISGQVIKVDLIPEPGFGTEMRLIVYIDKKEILPITLGPSFYIIGYEQAKHFKIGDDVTVTGSQVTHNSEVEMIAIAVKRGNEALQLRDKDGVPQWTGWRQTND